jgi:hypothetical protein
MKRTNPRFAPQSPHPRAEPSGPLSAMVAISVSYLWALLLMSVTIFEGYDGTIFHLGTLELAKTFHLDDRAIALRWHCTGQQLGEAAAS